MKRAKQHPPRFLIRFFRWYCHPKLQDYIEGDLMEVYKRRINRYGKRNADMRFAIDVLLLFRPGIIRPAEGYKHVNPLTPPHALASLKGSNARVRSKFFAVRCAFASLR